MQAIETRYHGATDHKGARISARAQAGRRFYAFDYALNDGENHRAAAEKFANEFHWLTEKWTLKSGCLQTGSYAHVLALPDGSNSVPMQLC